MAEKTDDAKLIRRIFVGTDGSEGALEAAQYAIELARQFGASVTLLHVVPPMRVLPHVSGLERERLRLEMLEAGKAILTLTQTPFCPSGHSGRGRATRGVAQRHDRRGRPSRRLRSRRRR